MFPWWTKTGLNYSASCLSVYLSNLTGLPSAPRRLNNPANSQVDRGKCTQQDTPSRCSTALLPQLMDDRSSGVGAESRRDDFWTRWRQQDGVRGCAEVEDGRWRFSPRTPHAVFSSSVRKDPRCRWGLYDGKTDDNHGINVTPSKYSICSTMQKVICVPLSEHMV